MREIISVHRIHDPSAERSARRTIGLQRKTRGLARPPCPPDAFFSPSRPREAARLGITEDGIRSSDGPASWPLWDALHPKWRIYIDNARADMALKPAPHSWLLRGQSDEIVKGSCQPSTHDQSWRGLAEGRVSGCRARLSPLLPGHRRFAGGAPRGGPDHAQRGGKAGAPALATSGHAPAPRPPKVRVVVDALAEQFLPVAPWDRLPG